MKKFKKLLKSNSTNFYLFILLISMVQCDGSFFPDTHIAPELPPYLKIGDTLIYKSDSRVEYFYVEEAKLYAIGQYGDRERDSNWDYEMYVSSITQFNCIDSCCSFGSAITPYQYWVNFKKGVYYTSYTISDKSELYSNLSLQIGNYKFNDLYGSKISNIDSITGNEISSILYSKKYGVVEYELTNGEVFTLLEAYINKMNNRHKRK